MPFWNPDFLKKRIHDVDGGPVFFVPSEMTLCNVLQQFGFNVLTVEKPYWGGPYASPMKDCSKFALTLMGLSDGKRMAFPGNMMQIIALKP